jgi:hypothetical protein
MSAVGRMLPRQAGAVNDRCWPTAASRVVAADRQLSIIDPTVGLSCKDPQPTVPSQVQASQALRL